MKVPIRATSDLHLTEATAPYVFAALAELRADAQAVGGLTMLLGDILNQAETVHMRTYNQLRVLLHEWPAPIYVLAGNHDQFARGKWPNALEALHGGQCRVISRPTWGPYGRMLPYTDSDDFAGQLSGPGFVPPVNGRFLLPIVWCHHGFRGAYRNAMSVDRDGVSCLEIPPRHLVVTGHYHMPQVLGRIIYCGSPYQCSFAEEGQQKGWLRWEDALANPIPKRIAYGDLGAPRHYTIHWDPDTGPPVRPPEATDRDVLRIKTTATRKRAKAATAQLTKAGLGGVPIQAQADTATGRGVLTGNEGPQEAVQRYIWMTADGRLPDPQEMQAFADEEGLWTP